MDPVGIANLALGWLGCNLITSLDDEYRPAELVNLHFAGIRRSVLEDRDWTFAASRLVLAKDAQAPAFGYPSAYTLPSTVLRVVAVSDSPDAKGSGDLEWIREGQQILANTTAGSLYARVIADVEDPNLWSAGFAQALATRLAADMAVPICQDAVLAMKYRQLYMQALRDAAANDGRQGRSRKTTSSFLALRRR